MPFAAQQVSRSHVITLSAPPDRVFPLFEPVREMQWASGWNPHMIYPRSGKTQTDSVFTVDHADGPASIWTIAQFEPEEYRITYVSFVPDARVVRIVIRCEAGADGSTRASITYILTGLSEQGNAYIERFTEEHYKQYMGGWETAINHFLEHGRVLQRH